MAIHFISYVDRIQCLRIKWKKKVLVRKKISDQFYPFECEGGKVKSVSSHDNMHASNSLQKNVWNAKKLLLLGLTMLLLEMLWRLNPLRKCTYSWDRRETNHADLKNCRFLQLVKCTLKFLKFDSFKCNFEKRLVIVEHQKVTKIMKERIPFIAGCLVGLIEFFFSSYNR